VGAELRTIRRRIKSVQSTMKITRAMELIAASRIVRAQRRVEQSRPYARRIADAIGQLAGVTEVMAAYPLLREREIKTVSVVVITSDRGLAGGYNSGVIRVAEGILRQAERDGKSYRLHLVGKKGLSYFRFRGYAIASSATGVSDTPKYSDAELLGRKLMAEFEAGETDQVVICYTDFRSAGSQRPHSTQILPIARAEVTGAPEGIPPLYEFEPGPEVILSLLLPRYVIMVVYAAMLESSASEHAARRAAMKVATDNAGELISVLTRTANRARQAEITTEIMDIIGGAEALRKKKKVHAAAR
jgi:F-type H+-transporting ATPase subunit gamma